MIQIRRLRSGIGPLVLLLCSLVARGGMGTPMTWGEEITKSPAWPKNSTLNVFVQADPDDLGRDALAKTGIERWVNTLSDRMITLVVTIGDPPTNDPPANSIRYTWEADGFEHAGLKLGPNDNNGISSCSTDGTDLTGGEAHLRDALPALIDTDKDFIKNLAEHEMTHILGLADDDKGTVTKHTQPDTNRDTDAQNNQQLNDQDKKEVNSLYGTAKTGGQNKPKGEATKTQGGGGAGFFTYRFDFQPTDPVPDPNDPEHVAFISIDVDPALVTGVILPPGWVLLPPGTIDPNDPYFSEGYMIDAVTVPSPWDTNAPTSFLALRTSVQQAAIDGIPSAIDPGLSFDTPTFEVTLLTAPGLPEGPIEIWAGDAVQTLAGPVPSPVPALSPVGGALLGIALLAAAARFRKASGLSQRRRS